MDRRSYAADSTRSREAFQRIVAPKLRELLSSDPQTRLIHVEGCVCQCCKGLDTQCSIDYLYVDRGGVRGVASRIQWRKDTDREWPYNTFTVRRDRDNGYQTERAKIENALLHPGRIRPALHVHAYATGDVLDSLAVVYTADLFNFIETAPKTRRTTNASFLHASWAELAAAGYRIRTWPALIGATHRPRVQGQVKLDHRPCISCNDTPTRVWPVPQSQQAEYGPTVSYCQMCEPFAGEALTAWGGE